ncbi:unnamed protein product [Prunus armeniaca]
MSVDFTTVKKPDTRRWITVVYCNFCSSGPATTAINLTILSPQFKNLHSFVSSGLRAKSARHMA